MAAERGRYVILMGLEVTDDASYARYRARMTPILESHGGSFGCDFVVAKVLKGPSERLNRVFTISFPDRMTRERSSQSLKPSRKVRLGAIAKLQ